MNIGIVGGMGAVGHANKKGFEHVGHTVKIHDTKIETSLEDLLDCDVIFICVPTPSKEDGSCDTSIVEYTIEYLTNYFNYRGIIAIRSTVEPGFTQEMIDTYKNPRICFVPEFLHERKAEEDFINNHKLLAIGTTNDYNKRPVIKAHGDLPKNTVTLSPTEAELLKYYNNVFASLRVTFSNVFYEVSKKLGADYEKIKDAYIKTGKATDMYMNVNENMRGYGGMCLPKDTKALQKLIEKLGFNYQIIKSIDEDNSKFKTTVFKGMRD
jgi:UDPglucose 6-dehydrogenase